MTGEKLATVCERSHAAHLTPCIKASPPNSLSQFTITNTNMKTIKKTVITVLNPQVRWDMSDPVHNIAPTPSPLQLAFWL
jgi:hypothetical protein